MRIIMDMSTGGEFHDKLSEFCEVYSSLGLLLLIKYVFNSYWYCMYYELFYNTAGADLNVACILFENIS